MIDVMIDDALYMVKSSGWGFFLMDFNTWGYPNSWMVYFIENPRTTMDGN